MNTERDYWKHSCTPDQWFLTLSINGWLLKDKLSIFIEFVLLVNFNLDGCVTDQIRLTIDLFDEYMTEWFLIKCLH